ncbi:hypothetical protein H8A95_37685 [Bradyrhizobium sp. Pear76]|uniref:hypothetical protein n=1 Tax=Bradyrhizobium oropedii TaxID=1571201 RepID=UPI001E613628|nr:hypothetical protein [Bradyrhizobium oropedii]MCC8967892.1 hypothetical protein [Bradyrhizobium oropedii]
MSAAEQVMISKLRETVALDHGRVRQVYDVQNCPGLVVVCELADVGADGEFETIEQRYEMPAIGRVFFSPGEALLAWDSAQTDHEIAEALGEAMLRYRHGLMRPLWSDRTPAQKSMWIAAARSFRSLLNSLGFDIVAMERKES